MEKIALVTDSTSDVDISMIEKYDLKVLPLRIIYKDKEYIDRVTISPKEVYDNLHIEVPSTSLPSMGDMEKLYTELENEGYTHVIAVTISSNLSGTHNSLKIVSENHKGIKSFIFDSKSITMGEGAIVKECGEMICEGRSFQYIIEKMPEIRNNIKVYYVVDTLKYLIKGGRIGKVSGTVGQLLDIKPIISINDEGVYYTHSKAKGKKQAIKKLIEIVKNTILENNCDVWVMHGGAYEEIDRLKNLVSSIDNIDNLFLGEISPVAGVHTGPGLLGIVIMKNRL
ncbi:DegV family protein [Clostridium felsineum]|uniref:DegV family protein n=1 Tax=Clostridium felsineum TaxID=36839 RepID=UPI00098CA173|nr:DegV family protein [Clostridium felsineum]URZ16446.1 DegV domain-containing protein [Clostridium felsineum DSM 794]